MVLVLSVGGTFGRRTTRWAVGLGASAAAWLVHATEWMGDINFDSPRYHTFFGHPVGHNVMTLGALIALAGGVVAFFAERPADPSVSPVPTRPGSGGWGKRIARIGLLVGLVGAAVYVVCTFLPYGGPSQDIQGGPFADLSAARANVCCAFGVFPVVNQVAAAIALWGAAAVVFGLCIAGLSSRDASPWAVGLTAAATTWALRTVGETVLGYIASPPNPTHVGYLGMQLGIVMALVGGLIALAGGLVRGPRASLSVEPADPLPA